jgi:hypothetical protein
LNNLACGQWWHARYLSEEDEKALSDFKDCFKTFSKSIQLFEGLDEDFKIDKHQIKKPESAFAALNVAEVALQSGVLSVINKQPAVHWTKAALVNKQKMSAELNGRGFTLLAVAMKMSQDSKHSEECFEVALKYLREVINI